VVVAIGIFSIAVQEFRQDNPGEGVTSPWLGRGRSGGLGVVAEKEDILNR
jgi:hypothetical protein